MSITKIKFGNFIYKIISNFTYSIKIKSYV